MTLLVVGVVLFLLGVAAIILGRQMHARELMNRRGGAELELLKPVVSWFVDDVLAHEWARLTGERSTTGERIAAAGAIISGIGALAMVAGVLAGIL